MKRVPTKFVTRLLTEDQKNNCLNVCYDLREQVGINPQILSKVVTRDETWCYGYDLETKQASSRWKTPDSPKPKRRPDRFDQMLRSCWSVFLMLIELCTRNLFLLDKLWINDFIWRCWKDYAIVYGKKGPEMWSSGDWFLHHDNAPAHTALSVQQFLAKKQHDGYPSSSLFTWPCAMRLFPLPLYEMPDERETFCWCQRSEKENAGGLEQHQQWRVPDMFSVVGKTLVQVYWVKGRVLWKRLEL